MQLDVDSTMPASVFASATSALAASSLPLFTALVRLFPISEMALSANRSLISLAAALM